MVDRLREREREEEEEEERKKKCNGTILFIIHSDLHNPPSYISSFLHHLTSTQCHSVSSLLFSLLFFLSLLNSSL